MSSGFSSQLTINPCGVLPACLSSRGIHLPALLPRPISHEFQNCQDKTLYELQGPGWSKILIRIKHSRLHYITSLPQSTTCGLERWLSG